MFKNKRRYKKAKKGQASTEMLITLGIILAFTIPVILLFFSMTQVGQEETAIAQAQASARSVADTINKMYAMGPGTKKVVYVNLPPTTKSIEIVDNEVIVKLTTSGGEYDAVSTTFAETNENFNEIRKRFEKYEYGNIILRHTIGYGILEIPFQDKNIEDIFVDSPSDKSVYVRHSKYGLCKTNITLSTSDLARISTRLRALSARPFDSSFPVIHANIPEFEIRAIGIMEPFSFEGTGFAFRKHKKKPWTLKELINVGTLDKQIIGLLKLLIEAQVSILITGPRGAGKTSLLGALMQEIDKNKRIIVMEDTEELPVRTLRNKGFNIQHLRIRTHKQEYEISASQALRESLRLGESVLIIGELRGEEAKVLFEAMRVGAAGNVVMGTIHGSSPYDTWDRIVNDLGVPSTSFKAADIIISLATLKNGKRVITKISEVKKYWEGNPLKKGFLTLAEYNWNKKFSTTNLDKSELMKNISKKKKLE